MKQDTIMIVTNSDDPHVTIVQEKLKKRSISTFRLDSDTFMSKGISWRIHSTQDLDISNWYNDQVRTVWYRKPIFLPETEDLVKSFIHQETNGLLNCILSLYKDARWINPLVKLERARLKLLQLGIAKKIGFDIPDSIVTSTVSNLRDFANLHNGRIIVKPIQTQVIGYDSNARIVGTRSLEMQHVESAVAGGVCYAQENLAISYELKVVVFGNQVHAFRLQSKEKYADIKQLTLGKIEHEYYTLDPENILKIQKFVSSYELEFGVVDFAVTQSGRMVFLELNPNGQWLWLQYATGYNLLDPFIDFLIDT